MNGLPAVTANFTNRALIIGALFTFSGSTYSVVVEGATVVVVVVVVVDGVGVVTANVVDCVVTIVVASGVVVSDTPAEVVVT